MPLSITLRQLEYAVAIAQHGGVTAAAEALHVSQPALSVALGQLEAHLGRPLFLRRSGGPIAPTSFGRDFLDAAAAQLAALGRLVAGEATQSAPVPFACFEDLAPVVLAPLLRRLAAAAPDLRLAPQVLGFEPLIAALRGGRIDLAVTYDLGLDAGIARHLLARVAPHAVLAADHPLAGRARLTLDDLANQPLILTDQGLSLVHMRRLFADRGLAPQIGHRAPTLDLMRSLAANGLGIGLSYTRPATDRSADGRALVTRALADAGPGEPVVLATLTGNPLSPAAVRLADLIAGMRDLLPESSSVETMAPSEKETQAWPTATRPDD